MPTSEPLHVAFVWHMHQPYYRSARSGAFEMPWARLHALKDYLDMVEILAAYPGLHQTFNLVPSLVEQLEDYASGDYVDVYWERTLKPAEELAPGEQAFLMERMCERSDHPRTASHPRYLQLAQKRDALASRGWAECARAFAVDELRDLQVWFNLAWFDPQALALSPLRELVDRGRGFHEEDKQLLAQVQADILARTLPAYRDAARRGQIELATSPYFHPILPLLANSDSARIASAETTLPLRRFAHPEDAAEHVRSAVEKHERVFGESPRGMWCSEQAVGEDVIPLLLSAGLSWTISDEAVLDRSVSGTAGSSADVGPHSVHVPYRLEREAGQIAIVFRDRTLSDLIGFAYRSWSSRDAAADLIRRLRELHATLPGVASGAGGQTEVPLVTIALDGENAWEYYPRDGRDFLQYLYEGLSAEPSLRCVKVEEHLRGSPPVRSLEWLHTGSWISADLRTWSGDRAHNLAWDLLHDARDMVAARLHLGAVSVGSGEPEPQVAAAWRHILIAEGSDWFWWFGDHHHTDLDAVWDLEFRLHLQEVYRVLEEPIPPRLFLPILGHSSAAPPSPPQGPLEPLIDGQRGHPDEWTAAGSLASDVPATMRRSATTEVEEVRFGWDTNRLCLLVVPGSTPLARGLQVTIQVTCTGVDDAVVSLTLEDWGKVEVSFTQQERLAETIFAAWGDVLEISIPFDASMQPLPGQMGLAVRIGRDGMTDQVFHSVGLVSLGWSVQ
jgi:alpha-amylase/alpha-mannosidase (GH57 family)